MIFTDYERTDDSPKKHRETEYAFLDRSARPEIETVRQFVVELLNGYPASEINEVVARLKNGNDVDFRSAAFELLIYDFLTRLGYKLQPHPELKNGSTTKPDFHVVSPDGSEFYLEAVLATEDKGENWSANAMINTVLDTLNSEPHPIYLVSITSKGEPSTQPSGRRIQRQVMAWLNSLDSALVSREGNFLDTNPSIDITHEGWTLNVQVLLPAPELVGKTKRLIGINMGHTGFVNSWTPIRDNLKDKGQRYGELELPLVVALNFSAFNLSPIDEMQALFGEETFTFSISNPHAEPKFGRATNGLWYGPSGPRARRVSGAWLFNDLTFYTAAKRKQTLYFNPWANHQLPEALKRLPHATMGEDFNLQRSDGLSLREVYKLDESWPEGN